LTNLLTQADDVDTVVQSLIKFDAGFSHPFILRPAKQLDHPDENNDEADPEYQGIHRIKA
jgi:hypothetical protein